ncbi:MAG: family 20 glycosylhydrolase [Opitutaceae bacterium]
MSAAFSPVRSFQWDLARQVERLDWLLAQLPRYAEWGYQELHIHLEDAVEFPSLPGVARRDAYSYRQFTQLVDTATRVGLKVVPIVNLLGHTQYLIKVPELRELNELRSPDGTPFTSGQVCPLHPRLLGIAEKLLRDMAPFCTAGKVHVGLDESFDLGRHPLSKKEIARIGLAGHFVGHVNRLHALTRPMGLRMGMWADMLYYIPEAIPLLPPDMLAYEWYYYGFKRWPRIELFNFAEADIATALRKRGLAIFGCPMNGSARYEPLPHFHDRLKNITDWWRHGERIGAEGILISSWEPFRLAMETTTVVDAAAASLWLEPGSTDPQKMLERGFERVFGKKTARRSAQLALASDRHPFGGYPRWQINDRWDTLSRREPLAPYVAEAKSCTKLAGVRPLPAPLRASLEFRRYLAARDVFVRRASRGLATAAAGRRFAKELAMGLRAAREMWCFTRDRRVRGANEQILIRDAERLRAWQQGKPVFGGRWQLCYKVKDFAPGLHLVGVEQQQPDGAWKMIQSCYTIEFQTQAAQPHGHMVHEHAAPLNWHGDDATLAPLRLVLRGIGEAMVGDVALTDGKTNLPARALGPRRWKRLGQAAPQSGLPPLVWSVNHGATAGLRF